MISAGILFLLLVGFDHLLIFFITCLRSAGLCILKLDPRRS